MERRRFSKRKAFNMVALWVNIVLAFSLLLSQLCGYVPPSRLWQAELIAISYPFILVMNVFFLFYWLIQQNRFVFISLAVIVAGYHQISLAYQLKFFSKDKEKNKADSFSVMSYNVRLFDLYNWTGNLKTRAKIFYLLQSENPDILCFQEYYTSDDPDQKFENNMALSGILKASNFHTEYGITLNKTHHWGLATFTSFPIIHKGKILFQEGISNFGMFTDVLIKDDTVRIYNVHLQSNHFKEKEYRFIESPDSGTNEQILQSSRSVLKLLKKAAIKRSVQVDSLKSEIDRSPYPVILCGDFNDPPFSYAYNRLAKDLNDAFIESGTGTGITLVGTIPFYRIDYILHDALLKCLDFSVLPTKLSDHHPIKARFTLEK